MSHRAAIMCVYNTTPEQLSLTKQSVESLFAQQGNPVELWLVDNGSTPETWEWAEGLAEVRSYVHVSRNLANLSPVKVANELLSQAFSSGHKFVLGLPNDVILPPRLYSELERWPRGIVTASMTGNPADLVGVNSHRTRAVSTCTPMAVALIRKWCHDALVDADDHFLDPLYFHYASDCDLALRLASCGITGVQLSIPYWHSGSASWKLAQPDVAKQITSQADVDRATFRHKWGFTVDSPEYGRLAGDINFRGAKKLCL